MNATAWISYDGGFGVLRCTVVNLSDSGAEIRIDGAPKLPKRFHLSFRHGVRGGRPCEVVWRSSGDLGVRFAA